MAVELWQSGEPEPYVLTYYPTSPNRWRGPDTSANLALSTQGSSATSFQTVLLFEIGAIPSHARLVSARLKLVRQAAKNPNGTAYVRSIVDPDFAPDPLPSSDYTPALTDSQASASAADVRNGTPFDITEMLAETWEAGLPGILPLLLTRSTSLIGGIEISRASSRLEIEWEPGSVDVTAAAPMRAPATLPPAGLVSEWIVTAAAPMRAPATLPPVDIVAPKEMDAAAPLRAGAALLPAGRLSGTGDAPPLHAGGPLRAGVEMPAGAWLSVEIAPPPPPPPWQRVVTNPLYAEALASRHPVIDARVEIIAPDGAILATMGGHDATHPGVIGGTVSVDSTRDVWWDCDLTIDQADLIPTDPSSLLFPLTYNRARVWWRTLIDPAAGLWAEIPVGTYHFDWPESSDMGEGNPSVTLRGSDLVKLIARAKMHTSVDVGGMYVHDAVAFILRDRAPWAPLALSPTDYRLPKEYEAGEPGASVWDVVKELMSTAGHIIHADRMGVLVSEKPSPAHSPVGAFIEGENALMTGITTSVPLDRLANEVIVSSTADRDADGNELEPITVVVENNDESSQLWVGRGVAYTETFTTDAVTSKEQLISMGKAILSRGEAFAQDAQIDAFPHPHLDPYDLIDTSTSRVGFTGVAQVAGWDLAIGPNGGQRIAATRRMEV